MKLCDPNARALAMGALFSVLAVSSPLLAEPTVARRRRLG